VDATCAIYTIPPLARSTWPLIHPPSAPARNPTAPAMYYWVHRRREARIA